MTQKGDSFGVRTPNNAEGKYFKTLFQNFSILIEFQAFKLYISVRSVLNVA
jgi:hypothetical protein